MSATFFYAFTKKYVTLLRIKSCSAEKAPLYRKKPRASLRADCVPSRWPMPPNMPPPLADAFAAFLPDSGRRAVW